MLKSHEDKRNLLLALMRRDSYLVLPNPRVKASRWTNDGKLTLLKCRSDAKRIYRQLSERERKVERDVEGARSERARSGRRARRGKYREILPLDSASTILRPTYPFLLRPPLCLPSYPSLENPGTRS